MKRLIQFVLLLSASLATFADTTTGARLLEQPAAGQIAALRQQIVRNLVLPEGVRATLRADVACEYDEAGHVVSITFIKGTGKPMYDAAIETAIRKAAPFTLTPAIGPDGLPKRKFEVAFRP